jgi:hypothetical protein
VASAKKYMRFSKRLQDCKMPDNLTIRKSSPLITINIKFGLYKKSKTTATNEYYRNSTECVFGTLAEMGRINLCSQGIAYPCYEFERRFLVSSGFTCVRFMR